jgi:hypothetical protein
VSGDTNHARDVFIRDRVKGTTERASVGPGGAEGNGGGDFSSMSVDGRFVAFASYSTNLVPSDTNATNDIFVRDRGPAGPDAYCFGDGSGELCPCSNFGAAGHGCDNSSATGGAVLTASGNPSLSSDSFVLTASGELTNVLSILVQSTDAVYPQSFGDGLSCSAGVLTRLFVKRAVGGTVTAPEPNDPSLSVRSSTFGDPIPFGGSRSYQIVYRDSSAGFCGPPWGNTFNVSNAIAIIWGQ